MRRARLQRTIPTAIVAFTATLVTGEAAAETAADGQSHGILAQALTITLPIAAAVIGYFIVYWNNWRLETRKAALKYVSDQLQFLYGPLFALNTAGDRAVGELKRQDGYDFFFLPGRRYQKEDIRKYRLWMAEVFMPINLQIEETITKNAHLIEGSKMPDSFGDMMAHIASYKATIKTWPDNPPSGEISYEEAVQQNSALLPYPSHFSAEVEETFNRLKAHQTKLLGVLGSNSQRVAVDSGAATTMATLVVPPPSGGGAARQRRKARPK